MNKKAISIRNMQAMERIEAKLDFMLRSGGINPETLEPFGKEAGEALVEGIKEGLEAGTPGVPPADDDAGAVTQDPSAETPVTPEPKSRKTK